MKSRNIALVKKLSRPQKLTRAAKQKKIHLALLDAAANIVGEVGYSAAMVSTITKRAGVAQGTFYNYFESRQDLFNQLLPSMSNDMLAFIKERASVATSHADREKRSFEAYFAYLAERPEFYRILYESEQFAPEAFQQHIDLIAKNYARTLRRASSDGEAREVDPQEYEAIAHMLMGMRRYLSRRYVHAQGSTKEIPDFVIRAYMRIVCGGFWYNEEFASPESKDGDREAEKSDTRP